MPKRPSDRYFFNYDVITKSWIMNKEHDYYHQVQSQLYFAKKEVGFFFFYIYIRYKLTKSSGLKDPEWETNIDLLINFYANEFADFVLANPDLLPVRTM